MKDESEIFWRMIQRSSEVSCEDLQREYQCVERKSGGHGITRFKLELNSGYLLMDGLEIYFSSF